MKNIEDVPKHLMARFLKKLTIGKDCWLWNGKKTKFRPTGTFTINNQTKSVRTWCWLWDGNNDLRKNELLLSTCGNKNCVNPQHCILATREGFMSKCIGRGSKNKQSKLTEEIVKKIRNSNESQKVLGIRYGVSGPLIYYIRSNKIWKNI